MQNNAIFCPAIARQYYKIMAEEAKLSDQNWDIVEAKEMFNTTLQIAEIAKSATVLRSYVYFCNIASVDTQAHESDGAHTNLMSALIDRFWQYYYGPDAHYAEDGYSYRDLIEATRRHDLPENDTGDIPDNGNRDEYAKSFQEHGYQRQFAQLSPSRSTDSEKRIRRALLEMEGKTSLSGKLLYIADKSAALIMALCYDSLGQPPYRSDTDPCITEREQQELGLCDYQVSKVSSPACFTSEMWTMDYFQMRKLVQYDDTGFFTALIVMYTLQIHNYWYSWREADYSPEYYNQ